MIPSQSLPLDEEAALYRSVFRANALAARLSLFRPPSRAAAPSYQSRILCHRCGRAGHRPGECVNPLRSIESIEEELQGEVDELTGRFEATGKYGRDEFGTFQTNTEGDPVPGEVQTDDGPQPLNWSTATFCLNCGEDGHRFPKCPKPPFWQLLDAMTGEFGSEPATPEDFYQFLRHFWG
jgi:hypothetical protein